MRMLWLVLREIINTKSNAICYLTCLEKGYEAHTSPTTISYKFNNFVTTLANNLITKHKYSGDKAF